VAGPFHEVNDMPEQDCASVDGLCCPQQRGPCIEICTYTSDWQTTPATCNQWTRS